jgi:hypothetical protein
MIQTIKTNTKEFGIILIDSLYIMYKIAIARNPCKKCIVRPCCSEMCSKKEYYIRLMLGYDSMIFAKSVAYFSLSALIFSTVTLVITMFK